MQHQPISSINQGSMKFSVRNDMTDYINLLHSYFVFILKLENQDRSNFQDNAAVAPINNIAGSLFGQLDVYMAMKRF